MNTHVTITFDLDGRWATVTAPGVEVRTFNRHNCRTQGVAWTAEAYAEPLSLRMDLPVMRVYK